MEMHASVISIFVLSILVPQYGLTADSSAGKFTATMGDKKYDLDVVCDRFSKTEVMFRSDDDSGYSEAKDTNGDNVAVYGQPGLGEGLSLALEINDNGELFVVNSSIKGQKLELEISENTLTGKGRMLGLTSPTIEFTLSCE